MDLDLVNTELETMKVDMANKVWRYDITVFLIPILFFLGELIIYISINTNSEGLFWVVLVWKMAHLDTLLLSLLEPVSKTQIDIVCEYYPSFASNKNSFYQATIFKSKSVLFISEYINLLFSPRWKNRVDDWVHWRQIINSAVAV